MRRAAVQLATGVVVADGAMATGGQLDAAVGNGLAQGRAQGFGDLLRVVMLHRVIHRSDQAIAAVEGRKGSALIVHARSLGDTGKKDV